MKISCIKHVPFEGPEAIATWGENKGHTIEIFNSFEGQLPDISGTDLLVIMGGPMGVRDTENLPWLANEDRLIREYLEIGKKAIGICLGAQLLASALGATVEKNTQKEIGWFPVQIPEEAKSNPILTGLEGNLPVFHWHGDHFTAPAGSTILFTNRVTPVQGFLHRNQVLALQFHLESTEKSVELLIENARNELDDSPYVSSERDMKADTSAFAEDAHQMLSGILDRFVALENS